MPRHFVDLFDLSAAEARELIDRAIVLKRDEKRGQRPLLLAGRSLGLLFEKPSLLTRVRRDGSSWRAAAWDSCSRSRPCARE